MRARGQAPWIGPRDDSGNIEVVDAAMRHSREVYRREIRSYRPIKLGESTSVASVASLVLIFNMLRDRLNSRLAEGLEIQKAYCHVIMGW
jgi:hypothetical protein